MSKSKNPRFTKRDSNVLQAIYAYDGMLTDQQIRLLFFPTSKAKRNRTVQIFMQRLIDTDYIVAANRQARARLTHCRPCVLYWLAHKGITHIAELSGVSVTELNWRKPHSRLSQLDHDVISNDFRIRLTGACVALTDFSVKEWLPARLFAKSYDTISYEYKIGKSSIRKKRRILPDSMAIIEETGHSPSRFLIEIDMSTHSQARIMREKIHAGLAYINSRQYRERFGDNTGRWLFLMESERRMENLQDLVDRELGKASAAYYFCTIQSMMEHNPLKDEIWFHGAERIPKSLETYIRTGA